MTATVVSSTGNAPQTAVETFTWELLGTSSEPGVTSNYPVGAADTRVDLELDTDLNSFVVVSADKQRVERAVREGFSDSIRVVPFDWGGWAELRVVARLADGRELVGRLRDASESNVRIPKRSADSVIAESWTTSHGLGAPDGEDAEAQPIGDGNPGDGLTLYEEYRGFYESGQHTEGNPKKKDFFVRNRAMFATVAGIEHFQRISGLRVHRRLSESELGADRVINGNTRAGPHLVDQHAIFLEVGTSTKESFALRLGNPRLSERIKLVADWSELDPEFLRRHVSHELFHTVNVAHHGAGDFEPTWFVDGGVLMETQGGPGYPIQVRREAGQSSNEAYVFFISTQVPYMNGLRQVKVGAQRAQHSGDEKCVMRYVVAEFSESATEPMTRLRGDEPEVWGLGVCTSGVGTGVNTPGRRPQPRFGDARPGRGDCVHQMLVNDAVTPPVR